MLKLTFALVLVIFGSALAAVDNDLVVIDERCPDGQALQCDRNCNNKCNDYLNPPNIQQLIQCITLPCNLSCQCDVGQGYRYSEMNKKCIPEYQCSRYP